MSPDRLFTVGCGIIILQCVLVGLLIWRKRFGCYSEQDYDKIAQHVMRHLYRHRQAASYAELDRLRHVNPKDSMEDCA